MTTPVKKTIIILLDPDTRMLLRVSLLHGWLFLLLTGTDGTAELMRRLSLYVLMATHVSLASGTYVFSKAAAVGFPDPESLTLARALGAAVVLLLLTGWVIPKPKFTPKEWIKILGYGFLLVVLNQYSFLRGLRYTVPSHPALFYALTPLGVLILTSVLSRSLPAKRKVLGVAFALAGVFIILRPWETGEVIRELRMGDFWVLCAVLAWVVYTVLAGNTCQNHDPRVVTAWSLILGAVVMTPIGGRSLLTMDYSAIPLSAWAGLAWLIVLTSVTMMLVWNVLLRYLGPVEVAICTNAQPPTTAALSALMAGVGLLSSDQDLGLLFWLGMVAVLTGVVLVQVGNQNYRATKPQNLRTSEDA
jgi:drug/metabolite transporter (DMT)-like permease